MERREEKERTKEKEKELIILSFSLSLFRGKKKTKKKTFKRPSATPSASPSNTSRKLQLLPSPDASNFFPFMARAAMGSLANGKLLIKDGGGGKQRCAVADGVFDASKCGGATNCIHAVIESRNKNAAKQAKEAAARGALLSARRRDSEGAKAKAEEAPAEKATGRRRAARRSKAAVRRPRPRRRTPLRQNPRRRTRRRPHGGDRGGEDVGRDWTQEGKKSRQGGERSLGPAARRHEPLRGDN